MVFGKGMEYHGDVMRTRKSELLALACLVGAGMSLACADVAEPKGRDVYDVIVVRNPFGLKDPPPALGPEATNPPPVKVDVKITGITANPTGKKAWFMIPPQPGKSANPKYFSVAEGGKENDIEVLEINENAATVKILNAGVSVVLNFREHGLAAPATLAVPGVAPAPGQGGRVPGVNPGVPVSAAAYAPSAAGLAPAPMAQAVAHAGAQPGVQPGVEGAGMSSTRTIPSRNLRTAPIDTTAAPQPAVDPAIQYIQLKAQEEAARQRGIAFPPVPTLPGLQTE